jgi:biotin transport system substrate-specific component
MVVARMSLLQALVAITIFVPGDLLKALATAFVAEVSYRGYPAAIASRA